MFFWFDNKKQVKWSRWYAVREGVGLYLFEVGENLNSLHCIHMVLYTTACASFI